MTTSRTVVLVFAEGSFEDIYVLEGPTEAQAFIRGLGAGASLYGAGNCGGYAIPDDQSDMVEMEEPDEISRAMTVMTKYPNVRTADLNGE